MTYWQGQLDKIEMSGGQTRIKIKNAEASTHWLDLTSEQYLELEKFLLSIEESE
jgi:hypothetical protein